MSGSLGKLIRLHVNMHIIKSNAQTGAREPVLSVKHSDHTEYANQIFIDGPSVLVYSPDKPLSCGAKVWIETRSPVRLLDN